MCAVVCMCLCPELLHSDNGMLEGALAMFRHGPPKTQVEIEKERERSISNGEFGEFCNVQENYMQAVCRIQKNMCGYVLASLPCSLSDCLTYLTSGCFPLFRHFFRVFELAANTLN